MNRLIWLIISVIIFMIACDSKENKEKEKIVWASPIDIKANNTFQLKIKKQVYIKFEPKYNPKKRYSYKDIADLSYIELELLRSQLYENSGYDYKSFLAENFFKIKYGRIISPKSTEEERIALNELDYHNERTIMEAIKIQNRARSKFFFLPFKPGHVLREASHTPPNLLKFYLSVKDKKPIAFENEEIPIGIRDPIFEKEISKEDWDSLIKEEKSIYELGVSKDESPVVFLVQYYPNKNLKYIISFVAYGGKVGLHYNKDTNIYDTNGILRRTINIAGDQSQYEREYIYDSNGEIVKILEMITQNSELQTVNVFVKNNEFKG